MRLAHVVTAVALAGASFVGGGTVASHAGAADDTLNVVVDERFELFSLLSRLAGAPEYVIAATPFSIAADEWFAPFADDAAVVTLQGLRVDHGISYDAALTLAAQLDDDLRLVRPLSPWPDGLDLRWAGVDVDAFLDEVRTFAVAGRFDEFLATQAEYTTKVEQEFRVFIADRPIVSWFDEQFGERDNAQYHVVPGLLTGDLSYGVHAGDDEIFAVVGLEAPDADGVPTLGLLSEELLVHELAHSYVNSIVHSHLDEFEGSSPALAAAADAMANQAYTTLEIVIDESIVRAVTILYLRDEVDAAAADASLADQQQRGFSWMPELVDALDAGRTHGWTDTELVSATADVLGLA